VGVGPSELVISSDLEVENFRKLRRWGQGTAWFWVAEAKEQAATTNLRVRAAAACLRFCSAVVIRVVAHSRAAPDIACFAPVKIPIWGDRIALVQIVRCFAAVDEASTTKCSTGAR